MPSTPEGRTTLPCWWGGRCGRIQAEASGLSDLMAAPDLVILSTRVVTGEGIRPAAVAIADGVITAVHEHGGPPAAARQLDGGDAAPLPGVGDRRVPTSHGAGPPARHGPARGTRAALAGARRAPRPDRARGAVAGQRSASLWLVSRLTPSSRRARGRRADARPLSRDGLPPPHCACLGGRHAGAPPEGPGCRPPSHGRDVPALSDLRRGGDPGRRHGLEMRPAAPCAEPPRAAEGG